MSFENLIRGGPPPGGGARSVQGALADSPCASARRRACRGRGRGGSRRAARSDPGPENRRSGAARTRNGRHFRRRRADRRAQCGNHPTLRRHGNGIPCGPRRGARRNRARRRRILAPERGKLSRAEPSLSLTTASRPAQQCARLSARSARARQRSWCSPCLWRPRTHSMSCGTKPTASSVLNLPRGSKPSVFYADFRQVTDAEVIATLARFTDGQARAKGDKSHAKRQLNPGSLKSREKALAFSGWTEARD